MPVIYAYGCTFELSRDKKEAADLNCIEAGLDALVSVKTLMEYLDCSRISVYRRCKGGDLPFVKIGGRVMFRRSDIEKWIARNTHGAAIL